MTPTSSLQTQRSRLESLFAHRPRRRPLERPGFEECALPTLAGVRTAARRGLLEALTAAGGGRIVEPARRRDPVLALVQRVTQGFRLDEYERARAMGYEAYLEEQLAPESIDDSAADARLVRFPTLSSSPKQLFDAYQDDFTEPYLQFKGAVLVRAVHSRRQLFERVVEFWNDRFSIDHDKSDLGWLFLPEHDRRVVRANAFGSFPSLLSAVAHGGAMLFYLDNWLNVRGAPQENYARELLELHTLGVRGGYNEVDVKEVAKCFTGWTLVLDPNSPDFLRATFDNGRHTQGPKLVLGNVVPNLPPRQDAQRVLDIVADHPSTARFLAHELVRWFLTPSPPSELVERVATTYRDTGGDVRSMLRVVLARENMEGLAAPVRPKFRRPFHFVVSLLRALGAEVSDPLYPLFSLYGMGHVPFGHVQPDGYPDTVAAWGSSLLPRWGFASALLSEAAVFGEPFPGVRFAYRELAARLDFGGAGDRSGLAKRIDARLLGGALPPRELELLQEFIDGTSPFGAPALYEALALAASLPGHQWY